MEKMRLKPEQIVPDVTVWNENNQPGAKSEEIGRKSITDKSDNYSLLHGISIIEPNSRFHDSRMHIDLDGTRLLGRSQVSEFPNRNSNIE